MAVESVIDLLSPPPPPGLGISFDSYVEGLVSETLSVAWARTLSLKDACTISLPTQHPPNTYKFEGWVSDPARRSFEDSNSIPHPSDLLPSQMDSRQAFYSGNRFAKFSYHCKSQSIGWLVEKF